MKYELFHRQGACRLLSKAGKTEVDVIRKKKIYRTYWTYVHHFQLKMDLTASEPSRSLEIG